jgi:seryl-tRNA synthetase
MLDINLLRRDLAGVVAQLRAPQEPAALPGRAALQRAGSRTQADPDRTEQLQARRNATSKQIGQPRARAKTPAR